MATAILLLIPSEVSTNSTRLNVIMRRIRVYGIRFVNFLYPYTKAFLTTESLVESSTIIFRLTPKTGSNRTHDATQTSALVNSTRFYEIIHNLGQKHTVDLGYIAECCGIDIEKQVLFPALQLNRHGFNSDTEFYDERDRALDCS